MKARAYMEAPPMSVVLCANRLQDRAEMEEALVHELVHVYDVSRRDAGKQAGRQGVRDGSSEDLPLGCFVLVETRMKARSTVTSIITPPRTARPD